MKYAIIGGTGVYGLDGEEEIIQVSTEYGDIEASILTIEDERIIFISRHGRNHNTPPHLVNYRANIAGLKKLGVEHIFTTAAVGSCNADYETGDIVIINDFIDFTKDRKGTFFEGGDERVIHVDMSDPYCKNMRRLLEGVMEKREVKISGEAVYACTEGPRFETAAEIRMFQKMGVDVVGMTSFPEVVLAKEKGICYSTVGIVTNLCTGLTDDVGIENVTGIVDEKRKIIMDSFIQVFQDGIDQNSCGCKMTPVRL